MKSNTLLFNFEISMYYIMFGKLKFSSKPNKDKPWQNNSNIHKSEAKQENLWQLKIEFLKD